MINSRQLAQLVGPTLSVMTIAEIVNRSIWENAIPSVTFLNGTLLFVGGLSMIRVHNLWVRNWTFLLALTGWLMLLLGVLRMFFPTVEQTDEKIYLYLFLSVLSVVGLLLTVKGYYPTRNSSVKSQRETR
jgi:hypothetical protein